MPILRSSKRPKARLRRPRPRLGATVEPMIVPERYSGSFIAWASATDRRIVASAATPRAVIDESTRLGYPDAVLAWIPPVDQARTV